MILQELRGYVQICKLNGRRRYIYSTYGDGHFVCLEMAASGRNNHHFGVCQ